MHQDKMALTFTKRLLIVGLLSCSSFSLLAANSSVHNYSEMDVVKALEDNEVVLAKEVFSRLNKAQQNGLTGQVLTSRILFREEKTEQSYDLLEQLKDDHNDNDEVSYYFGRSAIVMAQKASIFSKLSYASDALEAWEHTLSLNPKHIKALEGLIGFHIGDRCNFI